MITNESIKIFKRQGLLVVLLLVGTVCSSQAQTVTASASTNTILRSDGEIEPPSVYLTGRFTYGYEFDTYVSQRWSSDRSDGSLIDNGDGSATFSSDAIGTFKLTYTVTLGHMQTCGEYETQDFSDAVTVYVEPPDAPDPQWRDGTLSQGRKISLSGMPMPDVAQHQEGESDYKPEETYIDALSLDLQHSLTDIFVPVGSDHFSLEVRRNLGQEVWTTNSVPLSDRPDLPFGPCWSSAICPSLQVTTTEGSTYKTFAAQDHNGQTYIMKGIRWWAAALTNEVEMLWAEPQSTQSALSMEGVEMTGAANWVSNGVVSLSLPNGTVCHYSDTPTVEIINVPNVGTGRVSGTRYYRMVSVVDRAGHILQYNYANPTSMIPTSIEALSTAQSITITPSTDGKRVDSIEDPRGNHIYYSYTNIVYNGYTNLMLATVRRPDGGTTAYSYQHNTETDSRGALPEGSVVDYEHLTIESIVDANQNTNAFAFTKPERFDFSTKTVAITNDYRLDQIGNNRILSSITRPDESVVSFLEASGALGVVQTNVFADVTLNTDRTNVVTDVNGKTWTYVFSDAHATDPLGEGGMPSNVRLFEYRKMEILGPYVATETYRYGLLGVVLSNLLEPMAIVAQTNFSGQGTTFEYGFATNSACYKPSAQFDSLNHSVHYTYTTNFGEQVESETDALGRCTYYMFDAIGNRTNAIVYSTTNMAAAEILSETWMEYNNTTFSNFMTKKVVRKIDGAGDPSWASNLVTQFVPDDCGKVALEIVDPDGLVLTTTYDYDLNNNLISVIDPVGNITTNGYDALNRLEVIAFFDAADTNTVKCTKQFWYDRRSNKRWEKDENDHYTYFEYDGFNHLVKTIRVMRETGGGAGEFDPAIIATMTTNNYAGGYVGEPSVDIIATSEYNSDGTLCATVDPLGLRTEFQYDDLRRLTNSIVDPGATPHLNYATSYE